MKFETLSCLIMNNQFAIIVSPEPEQPGDFCAKRGRLCAHTIKLSSPFTDAEMHLRFLHLASDLCGGEA